jgi:hypothetical protein
MAQATTTIIKTTSSGGKVKITTPAVVLTDAEKAMVLAAVTPANPLAALVAAVTVPAVTTVMPPVDPMEEARAIFAAGLADVQKTSDRWTTDYAAAMNENMPADWWTYFHNDESNGGLRVRREQKAAYAALKAAGYTNPSVAWKRVRTAAAKLAGWIDADNEAAEEGEEGEGEAKASPYVKIQELIAAAIKKLSKLDADHSTEMQVLADCAKRLPSL